MTTLTRRAFFSVVAGAGALSLAACSTPASTPLVLGCGEPGGSYLEFGQLLAAATASSTAVSVSPLQSEGSIDNLRLLRERRVDLGLSLVDSAADAADDIVAIGRVYQNYLQCFVRKDGPVGGVEDLAGRRVSVGAPQSGAALTARRVLDSLGLLDGDQAAVVSELYLDEAIAAIEADTVDAIFWSGGLPLPAVQDLDAAVDLLDLTSALESLDAEHPGVYTLTAVPASTYGSAEAVPAIGVSNYLLARPDLPDDVARALVDVLIGDAAKLVPDGSLGVQYLTASNLIDTSPVELHPAAQRRYRQLYG